MSLTETAKSRIKYLLTNKPSNIFVKVGIRSRGCNGLSYTLNYTDIAEKSKLDEVIEDKEGNYY